MTQILLENINKSYGNNEVIHEVNCAIDDGEFIVIVGPSGCGKSTLLRMVAGLEKISAGTVSIGNRVVNELEPAARDIAMVFQNYALYPHMSVYNNMAYGLKIRGIDKQEIENRVNEVADILELKEYLQRSPRQLSGGQRQRVAMGRAIVRKPKVFLFDEPLSNLDAKLRVQMRLEIKKLQERLGITSIYVTHDQIEAMTLGHRLMVLYDGYVEQFGTPIELYETPQTKFVAGFIGSPSMNFIDAIISDDGSKALLINDEKLNLPADFSGFSKHKVSIGIRPEHFHLSANNSETATINVTVVEHLGADTLLHGTFGKSSADMTVRLGGIQNISPGEKLSLNYELSNVHVFSAESGKRLVVESISA